MSSGTERTVLRWWARRGLESQKPLVCGRPLDCERVTTVAGDAPNLFVVVDERPA